MTRRGGGKVSRKRFRQQRREGVTEKASAATEARCHGKGFGSNEGKVPRKRQGDRHRAGTFPGTRRTPSGHAAWILLTS